MSVKLKYDFKFTVEEVPALLLDLVSSNPTLTHEVSGTMKRGELDGTTSTSPQFTLDDVYADRITLSAGALTLDLTNLVSTLAVAKNFNGKKVRGIILIADVNNSAGVVVKGGASNPYLIWGSATGEVTVWPGLPIMQLFGTNLAAISGTVKTIDFSSADLDAVLDVILVVA